MSSMSSSEIMTGDHSGSMSRRDQASSEILKRAEGKAKMILMRKQILLCRIQDLPTKIRKENLRVFLDWLDVLYTISEYAGWGYFKKNALNLWLQNAPEKNGMLFFKKKNPAIYCSKSQFIQGWICSIENLNHLQSQ